MTPEQKKGVDIYLNSTLTEAIDAGDRLVAVLNKEQKEQIEIMEKYIKQLMERIAELEADSKIMGETIYRLSR